MKRILQVCAVAALLSSGALSAQNDTWEPNNSAGSAVPMANHIASNGWIAGLGFNFGPPAGGPVAQECRNFEDLIVTTGDEDWFEVTAPLSGALTVHMNQTGFAAFRLVAQILNQAGSSVLAGPSAGTYLQMSTSNGDPYNGARAQAPATQGTVYKIRVYYPPGSSPAMPTTVGVPYQLSVEWGTPDASEGTFGNNFPGYRPAPGTGQEADASPSAPGPANARVLTNRVYGGVDYYVVTLNQPAAITFQLENMVTLNPTFNFDVYWIDQQGNPYFTFNGTAVQGAEDTWPNGPFPNLPVVVQTPRTVETLTTPPLVPGTYYFHVNCWDTSAGNIQFVLRGGTYGVRVTITGQTDDALEGVGATQNDVAANATTILAGTTNNLRLLNDLQGAEQDWYKINVPNGSNLEVRLVVGAPATDNLNIRLYKPSGTPGAPVDLIDLSLVDNTEIATKGGTTAREIVGTWGTVGVNGNSTYPDGDFLIQITQGNLLLDCSYSLIISLPGAVNIAPEDSFEPNDDWATVSDIQNAHTTLPPGLTSGLRAMDMQDWYRFPVTRRDNVVVTLRYDAGPDVDLDLIMIDMNGGPNIAAGQFSFAGIPNFVTETTPGSVAQVQAVAGDSFVAAGNIAPPNGYMYIVVQRWGTRGCRYELNLNINGNNPLPPLVATQVDTTPGTISVPNSTTVTVSIRNQSGADATLQTLGISLTHSAGADVTSQYTIAGPNPALPEVIPATQTNQYQFTVTATGGSTNGTVFVTVAGTASTGQQLVGSPAGSFILTGGVAPAPDIKYGAINVVGSLSPGGVAFVRATVVNDGTQGGLYDNNIIAFSFAQAAANVTTGFTKVGEPTPALPVIVGAGSTVVVEFTFAIRNTVGLGPTSVTISGGGPQNPVNPGVATFTVKPQFSTQGRAINEGCSIGPGSSMMPPLAAALLAGVAFLRRRRR